MSKQYPEHAIQFEEVPLEWWEKNHKTRHRWKYVSGLPGLEAFHGRYDTRINTAFIDDIYVSAENRRKGIGSTAMVALEEWLAPKGIHTIRGHATDDGLALDTALGFSSGSRLSNGLVTVSKKIQHKPIRRRTRPHKLNPSGIGGLR